MRCTLQPVGGENVPYVGFSTVIQYHKKKKNKKSVLTSAISILILKLELSNVTLPAVNGTNVVLTVLVCDLTFTPINDVTETGIQTRVTSGETTEMCDKIFKKMYIKEETEDTSCPDQSTTKDEDADEQGLCSFFDSSVFVFWEQYINSKSVKNDLAV